MDESLDGCRGLFLDVGHGSSTLIALPTLAEGVLIDSADSLTTISALRRENINHLRLVLVTHSDRDHTAGIATVVRNFPGRIDRILYHPDRRRVVDNQQSYLQILKVVEERNVASGPACTDWNQRLEELPFDECRILYPKWEAVQRNLRKGGHPNRASAVLFFSLGGHRFLLGGDLEADGWSHLRDGNSIPQADVFLTPHHGGDFLVSTYLPAQAEASPATARARCIRYLELLQAVGPRFVIISCGTTRREGHPPHASVLHAIRRHAEEKAELRCLCTEVTPICDPDPSGRRRAALEHLPEENRQGVSADRGSHCPCAGTVVVRIDQQGQMTVSPDPASHGGVVGGLAHPQCRA